MIIAALEIVKAELNQEQQKREEVLENIGLWFLHHVLLMQAMAARLDVEEKSRLFIAEQHRKLEEEVTSRQAAEQQVKELQRQMASLRSQLNTSQENQKDFVELSQALQVLISLYIGMTMYINFECFLGEVGQTRGRADN